jgi:hypothetical protein
MKNTDTPRKANEISERDLILLVLVSLFVESKRDVVKDYLCNNEVNWDSFYRIATTERVVPIVFFTLKSFFPQELIANRVFDNMHDDYCRTLAKNTYLHKEFDKVIDLIEENEIRIVIFKGVGLSRVVYPLPGLRLISDMDILINVEDMEKLRIVLESVGFRVIGESPDLLLNSKSHKKTFLKTGLLSIPIDVHSDIRYVGHLTNYGRTSFIAEIWKNAKPLTKNNNNILAMSVEDSIINLIAHQIFENRSEPFSLVCDLGFIIERYGKSIDWMYIYRITSSVVGGDAVLNTLTRILDHFEINPPEQFEANISYGSAKSRFRNYIRKSYDLNIANTYEDFLEQDGVLRKLAFIFKYTIPSKQYIRQAYHVTGDNDWLIYAHYIRRIVIIPIGFIYVSVFGFAYCSLLNLVGIYTREK